MMLKKTLIATVAVLALAGCSSSKPSAAANVAGGASGGTSGGAKADGAGFKACSILTKEIASSILGAPVDNGTDEKATGIPYPSCAYSATSGQITTVGLTIFNSPQTADTLLTTYQGQYQGLTPLAGVGDQALQESDGRLVVAVHNHVGCVLLRSGDVTGSADASTKALADVCKAVFAAG